MKLVVTGAGGLLGRAVSRYAAARGARVFGIGPAAAPPPDWPGAGWRAWNMCEPPPSEDWPEAEGAPVVHLAGNTAIRTFGAPQIAEAALLARRAAELARRGRGGLIVVSSAAVYSGPRTDFPVSPLREDDPVEPRTAYGLAKLAAERAAQDACPAACILRLFSILDGDASPRGRGHLTEAIVRALRVAQPIALTVDAAGRPAVRDYLTPDQFAEVVWKVAERHRADPSRLAGQVINVGSGMPTATSEIVALAEKFSGRKLAWQPVPRVGAESGVLVADVARLRELLGATPASGVSEAVARLVRNAATR